MNGRPESVKLCAGHFRPCENEPATKMTVKNSVFRDVTQGCMVYIYHMLGGKCCYHLRGWQVTLYETEHCVLFAMKLFPQPTHLDQN